MTIRIVASRELCQGHARCVAVSPGIFVLDENGYIGFDEVMVADGELEAARQAVDSCPERALQLVVDDVS